jgi:hypothetical protein
VDEGAQTVTFPAGTSQRILLDFLAEHRCEHLMTHSVAMTSQLCKRPLGVDLFALEHSRSHVLSNSFKRIWTQYMQYHFLTILISVDINQAQREWCSTLADIRGNLLMLAMAVVWKHKVISSA